MNRLSMTKYRKVLLVAVSVFIVLVCMVLFVALNSEDRNSLPTYADNTAVPTEPGADWLGVASAVSEICNGNITITEEQRNSRSYIITYYKEKSRIADAALTLNYYESGIVYEAALDFNLPPRLPEQTALAPIDAILADDAHALFSEACGWSVAVVKTVVSSLASNNTISLKTMLSLETALHKAIESGTPFEETCGEIQIHAEPTNEGILHVSVKIP